MVYVYPEKRNPYRKEHGDLNKYKLELTYECE